MAMSKQAAPFSSGYLTNQSNPMLNYVVLQTLFEHASLTDLKDWRSVCKLWFEVSLPRWRRETWVSLTDNGEEEAGSLVLGKYVNLMNNEDYFLEGGFYQFRKHPIRRVKFANWRCRWADEEFTCEAEFWKMFGSQLTHLEIKDSTFTTFRSFLSIICGSFPRLEALLLLRNRYLYPGKSLAEFSKTVDDLEYKTGMSSLTELEIDLGGGFEPNCLGFSGCFMLFICGPTIKRLTLANSGSELSWMLHFMKTGSNMGCTLEKLDILQTHSMNLPTFELSNALCELLPSLTELSLDIGELTTAEKFKQILETCAARLRKLVVYRESGSGFMDENESVHYFPFNVQLSSLTELWMVGAAVPQDLTFLQSIPNLKRLLLICNIGRSLIAAGSFLCDQKTLLNLVNGRTWTKSDSYLQNSVVADTDFRQLETLVCSELEEFVVSGTKQGYCNPEHVAALARLMPNLKRVMLGLGNDGFRVFCENWKQLEALVVQPYAVDEFGMTGIVPGLKNYPRLPNITDLKSLRYFGMGYKSNYKTLDGVKVGLSDNSCADGLFELPNLCDLTVACANGMSRDMRAQLTAKFPNGKINEARRIVREWKLND